MASSIVTTPPGSAVVVARLPLLPPVPAVAIPGSPENAASTSAILGILSTITGSAKAQEPPLTLTNWSRFGDKQLQTISDDLSDRLDKFPQDGDPEQRKYIEAQLQNLADEQQSRRRQGQTFTSQGSPEIGSNTYFNPGRGSGEPVTGVPKFNAVDQGRYTTESLPASVQPQRTELPIQQGDRNGNRIDGRWVLPSINNPYLVQSASTSSAGSSIAQMPVGSSATIGTRPPAGGITVEGNLVSATHADISRINEDTWTVQDLKSLNGTTVNNGTGEIGANRPTTVGPGSIITLGDAKVQIPPRVVMHSSPNHPQLIGREGKVEVSAVHDRVSRNHVITSLNSNGNIDVRVESPNTALIAPDGSRRQISGSVQLPPGAVLALGPSYLVKLESATRQNATPPSQPSDANSPPDFFSRLRSLFNRTEPAPTVNIVRDTSNRQFPSAPPDQRLANGTGEASIEIGGKIYPIPNNGYLEVDGVQLYRTKTGGWAFRGDNLKGDWFELPKNDHEMKIERKKGQPLKFRFIAPPYSEVDGIPTISIPSLSQGGIRAAEKESHSRHLQEEERLLEAGTRHRVMAHGVELSKGGLNNLVGIAITNKVYSKSAPAGYWGILSNGPGDMFSGSHGPYWVAEGSDKQFDFIVPSEESRIRFFGGLTDASKIGLLDYNRIKGIASRTYTYQEYADKLNQRR